MHCNDCATVGYVFKDGDDLVGTDGLACQRAGIIEDNRAKSSKACSSRDPAESTAGLVEDAKRGWNALRGAKEQGMFGASSPLPDSKPLNPIP